MDVGNAAAPDAEIARYAVSMSMVVTADADTHDRSSVRLRIHLFEGNGRLLVSPRADAHALGRMGVESRKRVDVGSFSEGQRRYLDAHREHVFPQVGM